MSFILHNVHFLLSLGIPLCLPDSIASECDDKRSFARVFLYLPLHSNFKYGAASYVVLSSLNNDKDEQFLIPSLDSDMNVSTNLVFKTRKNKFTSTEAGKCQTSANPFLSNKFLTFEVHELLFRSLSVWFFI